MTCQIASALRDGIQAATRTVSPADSTSQQSTIARRANGKRKDTRIVLQSKTEWEDLIGIASTIAVAPDGVGGMIWRH